VLSLLELFPVLLSDEAQALLVSQAPSLYIHAKKQQHSSRKACKDTLLLHVCLEGVEHTWF
jgi:hypothetical protein